MTYSPDSAQTITVPQLNNIGSPTLSDLQAINRPGSGDFNMSNAQLAALVRKTPAGSRTAALPVTLTATDHDKNVVLTGTSGNIGADGTITDGFRATLINVATGAGTYVGIAGLLGSSSLASGASCTVLAAGGTVYATAAAAPSTSAATAYTSTIAAAAGAVGSPVTVTYSPTSGVWPTGEVITVSQTGGTGTFGSTTLSAPTNSAAPLSTTFTPSTANTFTISSSTSPSMTNTTGTLSYVASSSTATAYSMTESATSGITGTAVTLTFAPSGGSWPGSTTLTPSAGGAAGTFSPTTLSPTSSSTVTLTFTPSAAATITFSVTNNQSIGNPPNLTYVASAVASAYTQVLSQSTGSPGNAVRLTLTPTAGGWPSGTTITPSVSPSVGTLTPGAFSPAAGSTAAVVFTYTPNQAGSFALNTSTSPAMTNTSGAQSLLVAAATATSYTTATSANSGAVNTPVTITFTPNPTTSVWPVSETISPNASPGTGSFNFSSFSPSGGTTTPLTGTFNPTVAGAYQISSTTSPAMTNTTGALTYTATGSAPAYPVITTGGVTVQSIYDANIGVATSSGLVTALSDQSSNHNDLSSTAGASVGAAVNGFPSIAFSGSTYSANSGLRSTGAWMGNITTAATIAVAFRTGTSVAGGQTIFDFMPNVVNFSGDLYLILGGGGALALAARPSLSVNLLAAGAVAPNTVYKLVVRYAGNNGVGASQAECWLNGGAKTTATGNGANGAYAFTNFAIGQGASSGANSTYGLGTFNGQFLEAHFIQGALSDGDIATYNSYLASKWGS